MPSVFIAEKAVSIFGCAFLFLFIIFIFGAMFSYNDSFFVVCRERLSLKKREHHEENHDVLWHI